MTKTELASELLRTGLVEKSEVRALKFLDYDQNIVCTISFFLGATFHRDLISILQLGWTWMTRFCWQENAARYGIGSMRFIASCTTGSGNFSKPPI
jgi:hypothetical protein